jgi:hypothetical protein
MLERASANSNSYSKIRSNCVEEMKSQRLTPQFHLYRNETALCLTKRAEENITLYGDERN